MCRLSFRHQYLNGCMNTKGYHRRFFTTPAPHSWVVILIEIQWHKGHTSLSIGYLNLIRGLELI